MASTQLPADLKFGLYLNGEFVPAGDGSTFAVEDPATGEVLAEVANGTVEDAIRAVDAAHGALDSWAATPPRVRGEILRKAFEIMRERTEEIARLMVLENGKALSDARSETAYAAEFFRWYSEEAVRMSGEVVTAPNGGYKILVVRQPIGVSVLVTPWNFPAAMATRKIGPALAAGCSVILKPASDTPLTALLIAQILEDAGVPKGVVNVIPSRRSGPTVSAMLSDPRVRKISFTGSTEVGKQLLHKAADGILSASMELGGNAPFIVMEDADLDEAIAGAMVAKMRNAGEACTAANRFYVHAKVAEEFTKRLSVAMGALKIGPGIEVGTEVGPLINAPAVDKVEELVGLALGAGAEVRLGATRFGKRGYFYQPTVLGRVPYDAPILKEEIFGPVAPIVSFDAEDEVIAMANDTEFGLVSYLYTKDMKRGLRISESLESGMVGLNRGLVSDPAAPFGGVKQSGLGREGGHDGLLEFSESKYIATSW